MTDQLQLFENLNHGWTAENLLVPNQRIFRKAFGDGRAYLKPLDDKGLTFQVASGLTSAIPLIVPIDEKYLIEWKLSKGIDVANSIADEAREYGSMCHAIISEFVSKGVFDFSELSDIIRDFIPARFAHNLTSWQNRARKNIASICQWLSDKEVEPIFSEYNLFDSELSIATFVDFGCEMTFNKKRVKAVVDFKFTKSGTFGKPYMVQAGFVRNLWNRHAKSNNLFEAEMTFLLAPKDWQLKKGEPTYNFENCTGNKYDSNFNKYMDTWRMERNEALSKIESTEVYAHTPYYIGEKFEAGKHFSEISYFYQI